MPQRRRAEARVVGLSLALVLCGLALVLHARRRGDPTQWLLLATALASAGGLAVMLAPRLGY